MTSIFTEQDKTNHILLRNNNVMLKMYVVIEQKSK